MLERIENLYGDKLNDKQLKGIESNLDSMIEILEKIRSFPLENSDEPYFIFKPYTREKK